MISNRNQIKIGFINVWSKTNYIVSLVIHTRKQKEIMEKLKQKSLSSTESMSDGQSSGWERIYGGKDMCDDDNTGDDSKWQNVCMCLCWW